MTRTRTQPMVRLAVVLVAALLLGALTWIGSRALTPEYVSTARVVVGAQGEGLSASSQVGASELYATTLVETLISPSVAYEVMTLGASSTSAPELIDSTTVVQVPGTVALDITARAPDPREAARVADAWAQVSVALAPEIVGVDDARLTLVRPASIPTSPSSPRPLLWGGIAAGVGALVAVLVLTVRRSPRRQATEGAEPAPAPDTVPAEGARDAGGRDRGSGPRQGRWGALLLARAPWVLAAALLAGAGAALAGVLLNLPGPWPVRAVVGLVGGALAGALLALAAAAALDVRRRLVLVPEDAAAATGAQRVVQVGEPMKWSSRHSDPRYRALEPYRDLEQVLSARRATSIVTVVAASAEARPALRSIDVAMASAAAGVRTVLVGAGLKDHAPFLHEVFASTKPGEPVVAVSKTDRPHLSVLPLRWPREGEGPARELLTSRRLPLLLDRLAMESERVVLASPPLTDSEAGLRIAQIADVAVLVVLAGSETLAQVRETADRLQRAGSPVVAVVLVQRGRRSPRPVSWAPRAQEPSPIPAPAPLSPPGAPSDDSTAAEALATSLLGAGTGSGRAGTLAAPRPNRPLDHAPTDQHPPKKSSTTRGRP